MSDDQARGTSSAVGLEHVWLSYDYLNRGDIDGYASLLDADARLYRPGHQPVLGRASIERLADARQLRGPGRHIVHDVFASDGRVAAMGRFVGKHHGTLVEFDFADLFAVSEFGLLLQQKCYHFVEPG